MLVFCLYSGLCLFALFLLQQAADRRARPGGVPETLRCSDRTVRQGQGAAGDGRSQQSRQATIEAYIETLKAQDTLVERFEPSLWCALLDFVTVYSKEDVRFTFKDGTEIRA